MGHSHMRIVESKTVIIDGEIELLLTLQLGDVAGDASPKTGLAIRMSQQDTEILIGKLDMAVIEMTTIDPVDIANATLKHVGE